MKHIPNILGGLLGLAFVAFGLMFLLGMVPEQPAPPEGSPVALFMGGFAPTGYLHFVKICEVIGGILVAVPRTRNLGLLVLGPIIVNIFAFHLFVAKDGVFSPLLLGISALALFLLWSERKAWMSLVSRPARP